MDLYKNSLKLYLLHIAMTNLGKTNNVTKFNEALAKEMQDDVLELLPVVMKDIEVASKIARDMIMKEKLQVDNKKDVN